MMDYIVDVSVLSTESVRVDYIVLTGTERVKLA